MIMEVLILLLLASIAFLIINFFTLMLLLISSKLYEDDWSITEAIEIDVKYPEIITEVICTSGTCETTIDRCSECNRQLTLPKNEV